MNAPQYDLYYVESSKQPTSSYDVLGVGGSTTLVASDGNKLLSYDPGASGSIVCNISDKPLYVDFSIDFPDVRKTGIGRPKLLTREHDCDVFEALSDSNANLSRFGGEPSRGYSYKTARIIHPQGYLIFKWESIDDTRTMPLNRIKVSIADGIGDLGVVYDNPSRDDVDGKGEEAFPSEADDYPTSLSWNGSTQGFGMGLQQYAGGFPAGVGVETLSTAQGFKQQVVNNSQTTYTALIMYYLANYSGPWYKQGNIDGEDFSTNGHSRVIAYASLAPGERFICEPSTPGNYTSYSSIIFRRCAFADRYIYGVFN